MDSQSCQPAGTLEHASAAPNSKLQSAWQEADAARRHLLGWLFDQSLPLWWTVGTDHTGGGFFEKIDRTGRPVEEPRRTRVVGRQIYVFATAQAMGWAGPADQAMAHGIRFFGRCCLAPDGTVVSTSRTDGTTLNARFDLYDHAFALFGLAAAHGVMRDAELEAMAIRMLARLREGWRHPEAGFEESVPRSLPLKANPHMHIFEASLAWLDAKPVASAAMWGQLADEIGELCLRRFIDPASGALRELYDGNWQPMPGELGRIVEPGHLFEWAWLLLRWGRLRDNEAALVTGRRLVEIGESHGVDPCRGVAFNELWDDLTPKDHGARLWPQTERIKAWLAMARNAKDPEQVTHALNKVTLAAQGFAPYLAKDVPGTWHERMREDGSFLDEPSPASSLYHITCAIAELCQVLPALRTPPAHTSR